MKIILHFCILSLILFTQPLFAATKPLIVILDWFENPDHAPLFVAQEYGFFKQNGLDVHLINPADPSDPIKLVAAGKADVGISYQPHTMVAIDHGLPIVRIGTLVSGPLNGLTVLADGPIKHIGDLRGKRIGYSTGGVDRILLKTLLTHAGLTIDDVQLVNVHYGLSQALLSGKVDAVTGMMRNFEPIQLALSGHPARVFYPEDYGMPLYDELIYVINKQQQTNPQFQRFLQAVKQATAYLRAHPHKTWQAFAKAHPELNNVLNQRAWTATLPHFASDPTAFNDKVYQAYAQFLYQQGMTTQLIMKPQYTQINSQNNGGILR